nr:MAG: capsid protein [Parvo-like hybrid virus UC4]
MPRRPQRHPYLRGHARNVVEAIIKTGANPFAQFTRFAAKPSPTKTVRVADDIPASWKRKESPIMAPAAKRQKTSLPDLQATVNMESNAHGSGTDAGLKETPVDDPFNVQRGPPDYSFATLPYVLDSVQSANQWMRQHTFRMTSPYDALVTALNQDYNVGAGTTTIYTASTDAADVTGNKARWFDLYASMYKYYHVIACRWHVTIENQTMQPIWVHQYYGNATERPIDASNVDMMLWRDTKSYYVGPVANAISASGYAERNEIPAGANDETDVVTGTGANYESANHVAAKGPSYILQLAGEYRPGDADREIRTDNLVENWTLCSTNPALPERLNIRVRGQQESINQAAGDASNYNTLLTYRMFTRIEYLVEFKELNDGLKYPVATQPAVFSITTSTRA